MVILMGSANSAQAQYIIKEADAAYELFNYNKAIDLYEQAYGKKQTLHAAERLASCYRLVQNYAEAESWYAIAVGIPGSSSQNTLNYAIALQNNSKYSEAKTQYRKYAELNPSITENQKNIWSASCDSAQRWMKEPRPVVVNNQVSLNSKQSDWGAVAYHGGLVFSSDRSNAQQNKGTKSDKPFLKFDGRKLPDRKIYGWTGNGYLSLYEQKQANSEINLFPLKVSTKYHVAAASFSADEKEIYFTLTRIPHKADYENGISTINVEIYSSRKDDQGNWSEPVPFKYNNVSAYSLGDPFLTKEGTTLYFVSNMPGGKGGMDIYYSERTADGEWGKPVNAKEINTEGNERSPALDQEGNFYFSSDGRIGMGGLDIYTAKNSDNGFSGIQNMGYPINSPQDDFAYRVSGLNTGYFASNRLKGMGSDEIYSIERNRLLTWKLEGIVYKKGTTEPLKDAVVSLSTFHGGNLKVLTDTDGQFKFRLDGETSYGLRGDKTDFRSDSTSVSTMGLINSEIIKRDLFLEAIVINKAIRLDNIYYDFNKANIRQDAAAELDKLVKILSDNPTMWIELGSHTDSRGTKQYNQWLSQRRANSAVQYIIDRGISKNRITAKGYGDTYLLNRCTKGVKCTEVEHQLNRRTEFKIVKY
jgi:peptidoglycan-associated lipoprotein